MTLFYENNTFSIQSCSIHWQVSALTRLILGCTVEFVYLWAKIQVKISAYAFTPLTINSCSRTYFWYIFSQKIKNSTVQTTPYDSPRYWSNRVNHACAFRSILDLSGRSSPAMARPKDIPASIVLYSGEIVVPQLYLVTFLKNNFNISLFDKC